MKVHTFRTLNDNTVVFNIDLLNINFGLPEITDECDTIQKSSARCKFR